MWKVRIVSPPAVPGVSPHSPSPPNMFRPITAGSEVLERFLEDLVEALNFATLVAVGLAPGASEGPTRELRAALAERVSPRSWFGPAAKPSNEIERSGTQS